MIPMLIVLAAFCAAEWLAVPWMRARQWAEMNEAAWREEQVRRMTGGR